MHGQNNKNLLSAQQEMTRMRSVTGNWIMTRTAGMTCSLPVTSSKLATTLLEIDFMYDSNQNLDDNYIYYAQQNE